MKVKLKVLRGASAGKEFGISSPKYVIGRSQDCDLRPKSEAISRHHCAVSVRDGKVFVRDLKSRNGTFVNGERVLDECEIQSGDRLYIGQLVFEIGIDQAVSSEKRPVVTSVGEAAARSRNDARNAGVAEETAIVEWLDEADELERVRRLNDPETRHMKMEDTGEVKRRQVIERGVPKGQNVQPNAESETPLSAKAAAGNEESHKRPRTVGKLPPPPAVPSVDSSEAAARMLKKFFGARSS